MRADSALLTSSFFDEVRRILQEDKESLTAAKSARSSISCRDIKMGTNPYLYPDNAILNYGGGYVPSHLSDHSQYFLEYAGGLAVKHHLLN